MRKIVFPQESNLQPLDYRSTALPLELEKTPPRMLNFGYLNPATCLLYDCNNKSIKGGESSSQFRWFTIAKIEQYFLMFFVLILGLRLQRYSANTKRCPPEKSFWKR